MGEPTILVSTTFLLTGTTSIVLILGAVLFTLKVYYQKKFVELRNIAVGFSLGIPVPASFIISSFYEGSSFEQARTVIGVFGLICGGLGAFIIWNNIMRLRSQQQTGYLKFLEPIFFFALGFLTLNLKWRWIDGTWVALYQPSWGILIVGMPTAWVTFELAKLSYHNLMDAKEKELPLVLNSTGFATIFISVLILMVERVYLPGSTIFFVAFLGLGDIFISISLLMDPYVMIPNTIKGKYLIISDRSSGTSLVEYKFQNEELEMNTLFPGAMSGILSMLSELTGRDDLPPELGYVNLKIVIEESEDLVGYLIVEQSIDPLRKVLRGILDYAKDQIQNSNMIPSEESNLIKQKISAEFDFIG